jgi:CDP-diacylglycerol--serine O-phosphatidyltransferase
VRKIAVIPTLLTLGNAVCGFASIAYAGKISGAETSADADSFFAQAGWLIIVAMIFDALDGYVARLSKSTSDFGMQLDSLCDAISFGLAPAILLLHLGPGWTPVVRFHQALLIIAVLYVVCALLRLARFNVETAIDLGTTKRFRGLPSPGAAGCIASLAVLRGDLAQRWPEHPEWISGAILFWAPLGGLALALLMVSRIPYPHLTKQILRGRRPFSHLVQIIVAVFVIVLLIDLALLLLFWVYALAIPARYAIVRGLQHKAEPLPGLDEPIMH